MALLAAAVALHPLIEPDVFWHLASGRWILEHRAIPREDVFTWTMAGAEWLNFQWLFDVLVVAAWRWGGADALVLGKACAFAGAAAILVRACLAGGAGAAASAAAVGLAVLASAERTTERPEIASYLALAALVLLVERARRGARERELVLAPLIVAVWINLHSLAFLGPLLLLAHAAAAGLSSRPLARNLAAAGVAGALALLVNPYGIAAWTFPLTLFRRIDLGANAFDRILEFASPASEPGDPRLRFFWILIAATVLAFAAARDRRRLAPRLLAVAPFLALALLARRNVPLFAITVAPALAASVHAALERRSAAASRFGVAAPIASTIAATLVLFAAVAVLAGASPALLGLRRERGLGVMPGIFPEESLARADSLGLEGRLFHDLDFGGYIAWRDPRRKTFIDGRLEVVGEERLASFLEARGDPSAWAALVAEHEPQILLLDHSSRGGAAFLRALLAGARWRRVHESPEAVLLISAQESNAAGRPPAEKRPPAAEWSAILETSRGPEPHAGHALRFLAEPLDLALRPSPAPSAIRRAARFANLQLTLGRIAAAREGFEAILDRAPNDPEALFNLGLCALRAGDRTEARRLWEDALPRVPRDSRALFRGALDELGGP